LSGNRSSDTAGQHAPTPLENGKILIFDNGVIVRRPAAVLRVIEVNPATNEIVWTYQDRLNLIFLSAMAMLNACQTAGR
jgi:hypothetical protein